MVGSSVRAVVKPTPPTVTGMPGYLEDLLR